MNRGDISSRCRHVLEHMLLDESAEPTDLPLSLLQEITNDFSDDQLIGAGGFGLVYKGLLQNGTVAVKKLDTSLDIDEKKFNQEVQCLIKTKHKNVVRFLGYCADTQGKQIQHEGKYVMADLRNRLLCFEYVSCGSLNQYIADASCGLEWRDRYRIIKGLCDGLHYLHEKRIVHLDLKPANILVDDRMVIKIADFGLSKCFDENQSRAVTSKLIGSIGYLAPESFNPRREITFKLDIYSLGVIILEMVAGGKGYFDIEKVVESWMKRLDTSECYTQVRVCTEIGIECMSFDPTMRPTTRHIVDRLDKIGGYSDCSIETGTGSLAAGQGKKPGSEEESEEGSEEGSEEEEEEEEDGGDVDGKLVHFDEPLAFTVDELMCATAQIIGKSTYGMVYRATLEDGSLVAVERLREKNTKAPMEFEAEAAALGKVRHPNLLALRAYYLGTKGEMLLVFDYMPKGSLSAFLHARAPNTPVDWATRMTIAKGMARGLAYLHDNISIVHGNLTSNNVLLDAGEGSIPKIADIGLSRLMTPAMNSSVVNSSGLFAAGALGYRAPELSKLKKASTKTDVYSLGIIVLELLTGRSPSDKTNGMDLPQWVASIVKKEWTSEVFDLELVRDAAGGRPEGDELMDTLKLALHCVDPSPAARPHVREVLRQLDDIRPGPEGPGAGPSHEGHVAPAGSE